MRRGFTLLEILVTIVIFSILVTISGYVYASALSRSRDQQRISDLQTISNGLEQFYLDHKSYPSYGATGNPEGLFLAKFQLEPFGNCLASHDFLVPTYLAAVPEDPRSKFVFTGSPGCGSQTGQAGQYLYVPVVTTPTESVKNFQLAAKVERSTNASAVNPTSTIGYYRSFLEDAGIVFCTNTVNPSCTHNRFLAPKNNQ